jgi:hypothetical protein
MASAVFLNQVNPGVTKQGRAIFDVAPDAKGMILRAGDTNIMTDENAYINLARIIHETAVDPSARTFHRL